MACTALRRLIARRFLAGGSCRRLRNIGIRLYDLGRIAIRRRIYLRTARLGLFDLRPRSIKHHIARNRRAVNESLRAILIGAPSAETPALKPSLRLGRIGRAQVDHVVRGNLHPRRHLSNKDIAHARLQRRGRGGFRPFAIQHGIGQNE